MVEDPEDRAFEPVEPAPVDRLVELGDPEILLIGVEIFDVLRAGEEELGGDERLVGAKNRRFARDFGLVALVRARTEGGVDGIARRRDQRGEPIFVAKANPAAGGLEALALRARFAELF